MNDVIINAIINFIKNRTNQGESTAPRHIHRRFDISIEEAEQALSELKEDKIVNEMYDEEYQENRFKTNSEKM